MMQTDMAQAMVFQAPGTPLELQQFPFPMLGEGELLVRVTCSTICGSDLHTFSGRRATPAPTILGHEIVGVVEAEGPGSPVRDLQDAPVSPGDRITWSIAASCAVCFYCRRGLPQKCERLFKYGHERITAAHPLSGGLAQYCHLAPGTAVMRLPDDLPDMAACPANCATATIAAAFRTARAGRDLPADASILVQGAGMLGLTACAMAATQGYKRIIAADVDMARLQLARTFGATHCVEAGSDHADGVRGAIEDATNGKGVDLAMELSGAHAAMKMGLDMLRMGGQYVFVGAPFPTPPLPLDPERIIRRVLTLHGVHNYIPEDLAHAVRFLERCHTQFPFAGLVAQHFRLEQAQEAFQYALERRPLRIAVIP